MCTQALLDNILVKITNFSKEKFGDKFKNVILYGSYARGDFDSESDIDIMVIADMPPQEICKHRWDFSCFTADLNIENNILISIKLQSFQLFEEWNTSLPYYKNVLRDGVIYA